MVDDRKHEPTRAPVVTPGYPASRRDLLRLGVGAAVAGGAALTGCSGPRPAASATAAGTSRRPGSTPTPTAATASVTPLPPLVPWQAVAGEVHPEVKRLATRVLQTIGSWDAARGGSVAAAEARLRAQHLTTAPNLPGALAAAARPLLGPQDAAVTAVVDAQYGGIVATSASVLVVLEQHRRRADGGIASSGSTVDVRLVRGSAGWRVTSLRPAHPGPAAAGPLTAAATRLLASARVRLPVAGRADVAAGLVHDSVCRALLSLSRSYLLDVSVVRSGHPTYVFGTTRPSDHPQGRAVDLWALDDRRVVEPQHRAFVGTAMRAALATGAYQVGGPVDLDSGGLAYFSDQTHQDHLHLGFRT